MSERSRPDTRTRRWPLRPVRPVDYRRQTPTYRDADPGLIDAALSRALSRPSGNWYVLAASDAIRPGRPFAAAVAGTELVAWRDARGTLRVAPGACPHLGAPLGDAVLCDGRLICRWHGLRLTSQGLGDWQPYPAHDDGVLAWVRLDHIGDETPTPAPILPARPDAARRLHAVYTTIGRCEPADIIANRLDPWHGSWLHPYSFTRLRVLSKPRRPARSEPAIGEPGTGAEHADSFVIEVTFRVGRAFGTPVIAEFACPEPRTIAMHIIEGEGAGSVVETHATALSPGPDGHPRTQLIEAVIATSARRGFRAAQGVAPLMRPLIRHAAGRLWRDDLPYAERRYRSRTTAVRRVRDQVG